MTADNEQRRSPGGIRADQAAYPSAPWRLRGEAICLLQRVKIARAQAFVPPALSIVPVSPGKTLGGLFLARYGPGSTLAYNELIVLPALVWRRGRIGGWVSHIYVDEAASVAGGRKIWGLPKERATFERSGGREVTVRQEGAPLCTLRLECPRRSLRIPVVLPAFGRREGLLWFRGSGRASVGLARAEVDVPSASPFAFWQRGGHAGIGLQDLDITIHAPKHLRA